MLGDAYLEELFLSAQSLQMGKCKRATANMNLNIPARINILLNAKEANYKWMNIAYKNMNMFQI